jgi:hypothetical protein
VIVRVHDGGQDMGGLVRYLTGPGKANEHANQHVVAASETLAAEFAGTEWDGGKTGDLARILDGSWRQTRREQNLPLVATGDDAGHGAARAEHVFHVSLSLGADQGKLSDQTWAQIAGEYVDAMDFAGPTTAASGRAECQWVAVHHGSSKNGGDHIHIAVCLVREDLTRAQVFQSYRRSRTATDDIEKRHGLRAVKDTATERGLPGFNAAEAGRAARQGDVEVGKLQIGRRLRAAAAVSTTEAEFVASARLAGVMVRPRFAAASTDQVTGYSAALRPPPGATAVWYAPSKLDRNLGLGQLRARWGVDVKGADDAGRAAVAMWRAPKAGGTIRGGSMPALAPQTAVELSDLTARLSKIDPADSAGWKAAAREASYVFARWSVQVEGAHPGPLAAASDSLARSAQPDRDQRTVNAYPGLAVRQIGAMVRATSTSPTAGWLAVMGQLDRVTQAIEDAHRARGELVAVQRIEQRTGLDLGATRAALTSAAEPAPPAPTTPEDDVVVEPVGQEGEPLAETEEDAARRAIRDAASQMFPTTLRQSFGSGGSSRPPSEPQTPATRKQRAREDELER